MHLQSQYSPKHKKTTHSPLIFLLILFLYKVVIAFLIFKPTLRTKITEESLSSNGLFSCKKTLSLD
jgi:hypothetical protein